MSDETISRERNVVRFGAFSCGGIGGLGARLREQVWPTQPRIVECRVRPVTPLELSQGAEIGLSTRAVMPSNSYQIYGSGLMDFNLVKPSTSLLGSERLGGSSSVWTEKNRWGRGRFGQIHSIENEDGLKWTDFALWTAPLEVEVSLRSSRGAFLPLKRKFELRSDGIEKPDPAAARHGTQIFV